MQLSVQIFLENDDEYVFDPKRRELLLAIDDLGSIRKATRKLKMSYRWAWGSIKDAEKKLGVALLERTDQPMAGRPKMLTPAARDLLSWFVMAEKDIGGALINSAKDLPGFLKKCPADPLKMVK